MKSVYSKILKDSIASSWAMICVFLLTIVLVRFFTIIIHHKKVSFYKEAMNLFALFYSLILFSLLTNSEANIGGGYNIMPFTEMTRYTFGSNLFMLNVVGNILAFIPFGYFIGHYVNPKKIWPVIITSLITGITVELVQLRIGRSFERDDILLNLFGSILGYLLYIGLSAINKKLPDVLKSDLVYNIITIVLLLLFGIYIFGYWGVVFK